MTQLRRIARSISNKNMATMIDYYYVMLFIFLVVCI